MILQNLGKTHSLTPLANDSLCRSHSTLRPKVAPGALTATMPGNPQPRNAYIRTQIAAPTTAHTSTPKKAWQRPKILRKQLAGIELSILVEWQQKKGATPTPGWLHKRCSLRRDRAASLAWRRNYAVRTSATIFLKASGSFIAKSARTLRFKPKSFLATFPINSE